MQVQTLWTTETGELLLSCLPCKFLNNKNLKKKKLKELLGQNKNNAEEKKVSLGWWLPAAGDGKGRGGDCL